MEERFTGDDDDDDRPDEAEEILIEFDWNLILRLAGLCGASSYFLTPQLLCVPFLHRKLVQNWGNERFLVFDVVNLVKTSCFVYLYIKNELSSCGIKEFLPNLQRTPPSLNYVKASKT